MAQGQDKVETILSAAARLRERKADLPAHIQVMLDRLERMEAEARKSSRPNVILVDNMAKIEEQKTEKQARQPAYGTKGAKNIIGV